VSFGDEPCRDCTVHVTSPEGTINILRSGSTGNITIRPLSEGTFNITLVVGGDVVGSVLMQSLVAPEVIPEAPPTLVIDDLCIPILLLLLSMLLVLLYLLRSKEVYAKLTTKVPKLGKAVILKALHSKDNKPVKGVKYSISLKGKPVASGLTNKSGTVSFTPKKKGDYVVKFNGEEKLRINL
jgi:hypothetical protein